MGSDPGFMQYVAGQLKKRDWLMKLVSLTTHELPPPKQKKKKAKGK